VSKTKERASWKRMGRFLVMKQLKDKDSDNRYTKIIERLIERLSVSCQNRLYEIVLKNIPLWLLKLIPCSYTMYLKCFQPKRGDVIIDSGAHIGNCSIVFSRLVKNEGLVIALEPGKDAFEVLEERKKRLRMDNVIVVNKGLWESDTRLSLRIFDDSTKDATLCNEMNRDAIENDSEIDCIKLDTLVDELNLVRLDMVKMDIEGAEIEALKGAEKTIMTLSPCFAIASYHIRNNKQTYMEVENRLKDKGYSVQTLFPPHLTTLGYKNKKAALDKIKNY
jgi:FkbM family methyltransferase